MRDACARDLGDALSAIGACALGTLRGPLAAPRSKTLKVKLVTSWTVHCTKFTHFLAYGALVHSGDDE